MFSEHRDLTVNRTENKEPHQNIMNQPTAQTEFITQEPFYATQGEEIQVFEAAYNNCIPVLLKLSLIHI